MCKIKYIPCVLWIVRIISIAELYLSITKSEYGIKVDLGIHEQFGLYELLLIGIILITIYFQKKLMKKYDH